MVRITALLIKLVAATVVYLFLQESNPDHAITLSVAILNA